MSEFRKHGRKLVKCAVRLNHKEFGEIVTETRDISETGVFVSCADLVSFVAIGERIQARLYADCDSVSETHLEVVRLSDEGVGLAFI